MKNTSTVGISGSAAAALIAVLSNIDAKFMIDMGADFWSATVFLLFALPAFGISAMRYFLRLRRIRRGEEK